MSENGSMNHGLTSREFFRLSQLEEAVFSCIRDGLVSSEEYLRFLCSFSGAVFETAEFEESERSNIETAKLIIKKEDFVGSYLKNRGQGGGDYIQKLKKFLREKGIKIDFRKTPLK